MKKICEHEGCQEEGLYRAPKDKTLKEYYSFCLKHVKEYNKKWDYYKNATAEEVERDIRRQYGWDRPTWKFGVKRGMNDPLGLAKELGIKKTRETVPKKYTATQEKAFAFFGLTPPFSKTELAKKYRALAKKFHPDTEKGDPVMFRKTVDHYQTLKKMLMEEE